MAIKAKMRTKTKVTAPATPIPQSCASVVEALRGFAQGDAAPLALVLETRRQQQRRANAKSKNKSKRKNAAVEDDSDAENDFESVDEQIQELPRATIHQFCQDTVVLLDEALNHRDNMGTPLADDTLQAIEVAALFSTIVASDSKRLAVDPARVFAVAQVLHDHLLSLRGDMTRVQNAQDAVSILCETCWHTNYHEDVNTVVTQLLPYLIVRSYGSETGDHFMSKRHPIRRLFAIKDALLLLDFDDPTSGLLRDVLLRCYIQPNFFRSPDAVAFLGFLFELHLPFISDINATIRNQIPNQRKSILKKYGAIYFKAWVGSKGDFRTHIEEECIQRYVHDAVHARSLSLFAAVRAVLQIFFENKRHAGVDEMLYRISSPVLWRGVKAANDSVRRQAAVLLFDNFPLRDPSFNNERMDLSLQKQFDCFEELLGDSHPAVRIAAIQGVAKVLSVYWELLPAETIRCFISKLAVDLVNDISSSAVRVAVFEGIQFILDNHNSHSVLKPLLPMLAPLINDRNERVRAEFSALLVRIKSIRNMHFYDVVSVSELLDRLVLDRNSPLVRKQLVLLFLNSYFPQSVGGSSQVARCLALVKKNPEAAMVFYANVAEHTSVGSVCKLAALLCRCSLNFVSKRLRNSLRDDDENDEDDDDDDDDGGFSVVGRIVVLEIMADLLKSIHGKVLNDERYAECKTFLAEQLPAESLDALLGAYSQNQPFDEEALSSVWKIVGYLGELTEGSLLEQLVGRLMKIDETSSKKLLDSMVDCLTKWEQLPFLVTKIDNVLRQWKSDRFAVKPTIKKSKNKADKPEVRFNPIVALSIAEYIFQSSSSPCPMHLMDYLVTALTECVSPLLGLSSSEFKQICANNSFGLVRLLEVYAKILVRAEATNVSHQVSHLLDATSKKAALHSALDTLKECQPAALFTPPQALAKLLGWVARMLFELHSDVDNDEQAMNKKRRRGKKNDPEQTLSPDEALLCRWRNLFSLVALLTTECVAFVLQCNWADVSDEAFTPVGIFMDTVVNLLRDAADDMVRLDHAIIFHSCHLLALVNKELKAERHQTHARRFALWVSTLQRAVIVLHGRYSKECEDLFAPIQSLLGSAAATADESDGDGDGGNSNDDGDSDDGNPTPVRKRAPRAERKLSMES